MLRTETLSMHHSHRTVKGIIQSVIIYFFSHFVFSFQKSLYFSSGEMVTINTKVTLEVQVVICHSARYGRINLYN